MKRKITVILLACLTVLAILPTSGCIFNDGSIDEVEGIYGVEDYFYRDINTTYNRYGAEYDYYLIVLYKDKSAKIIYRKTGAEEVSMDTSYTVSFYTDEPSKVEIVTVKDFSGKFYASGTSTTLQETKTSVNFTLRPKREDLVYRIATLRKDKAGRIVDVVLKYEFHKLYESTSDRKIERAKKKQIESIGTRGAATDNGEEE